MRLTGSDGSPRGVRRYGGSVGRAKRYRYCLFLQSVHLCRVRIEVTALDRTGLNLLACNHNSVHPLVHISPEKN